MRTPFYTAFGFMLLLGSTLGIVFAFPRISNSAEVYPSQTAALSLTQKSVHLLFIGDMMFDRSIRKVALEHGYDYILACSKDRLGLYDEVIGNLEGPITDNASLSMGSIPSTPDNFTFTFPPEVADLLARFNIGIVNLGNNHISNFGFAGLASTRNYLDQAGVKHFGGLAGDSRVLRTTIQGKQFSFVNFNEFGGDATSTVIDMIRTEKDAGQMVIVFTHWGDEYVKPPTRVENWAKAFADAGASLIIGTHPHVVQKNEIVDGVPVFYSLGNFVFDQYWDDAVTHGEVVDVTITGNSIETRTLPVALGKDRRTCIDTDQ